MAKESLFPTLKGDKGNSKKEDAPAKGARGGAAVPDLFGEPAQASTTPASQDSTVVNAVVNKEDTNKEQILGPKPQTSSGLNVRAKSGFNLGGLLSKIAVILGVLTYLFFYTQLNPNFALFGPNPAQRLEVFEESFAEEQNTINLYNYMVAKFALDDFVVSADSYLLKITQYESAYTSVNTKADLEGDLVTLQDEMKASLQIAKEKFSHALYPTALLVGTASVANLEDSYVNFFKARISEEKHALMGYEDEESTIEDNNLESILALLNDQDFRREITASNLEEDLDPDMVQSLFEQATETSKNALSSVLSIKGERVNWTEVLDEIESVTKEIDPLYGTGITGNIEYSNFSFTATDHSINMNGSTRTDDTLNFSLISDLLDALEQSPMFTDVTERSFTKSDSTDGFTAVFNIQFTLQEGADSKDAGYVPEDAVEAEDESAATGTTSLLHVSRVSR